MPVTSKAIVSTGDAGVVWAVSGETCIKKSTTLIIFYDASTLERKAFERM
jgi:hypothetical protein